MGVGVSAVNPPRQNLLMLSPRPPSLFIAPPTAWQGGLGWGQQLRGQGDTVLVGCFREINKLSRKYLDNMLLLL